MGKPRSEESFSRVSGRRQPAETVLIVCEGKKTEPGYFQAFRRYLRLTSVQVNIVDVGGGGPSSLLEKALDEVKQRQHRKALPFDEIWCVLDTEGSERLELCRQANETACAHNIRLSVSNPAFEFWYLLHFEFTTRPFAHAREVIEWLHSYLKDYEKNRAVFDRLVDLTDTAIEQSRRVIAYHQEHSQDVVFPCPSTQVHELVEKLKTMAER